MKKNTKELSFNYILDSYFNILASIDDLIPNPRNIKIYGNENKENSKIKEIADDMKKRIEQGLSPNSKPIPVTRSGKMKGGHTRLRAAKLIGAKYVHVVIISDEEWSLVENKPHAETQALLHDNLLMREKTYDIVLGEYNELETSYYEEFNQLPTDVERNQWIKQISTGTSLYITKNTIDNLKIIKSRDPSLFEQINKGKLTVNKAYKMVKNFKKKNLPRENRNLINIFRNNKENTKRLLNLLKQAKDNFISKNTFKHEDGEVVNWVLDEYCGTEMNYISNSFSQMLQGSVTSFFRKYYPEMDARSPRSEQGAPDTQFHAYNLPGVDPLRLESKVTDSQCQMFYFGLGGAAINPHEFMLIVRQGIDRFCVFITTLKNEQDARDIKSQGQSSVMALETWFKNHYDKNDWFCLHGNIRKSQNGNMEIIYEKL